jgi:hypothetical protein
MMTWENFVSQIAIGTRRRAVAGAVIYGLSLAIRFTSPTGEQVEISPQALYGNPMTSVMINDGAQLLFRSGPVNPAQPGGIRRWLTSLRGCSTACESRQIVPGCPAPP